ncbi:cytochrome c550 [Ornithinibacillus bavariensis]|uniref:Cytochrome c-550 n=1 Tax=Ornithinibacillus bavariensis TaxID=545502 RepID=A0A920C8D7_9BACI|nr:cytochrome c [Ornithinibacillus bavariensis]GIO27567.1 cytochrome c-550 [Ornithinibacillus bavariensis]HAM81357.1 cytochrome C [Ornithinibacillus sp.]
MKRNPVIPYAIIAIIGILAVIIISAVGIGQRDQIASGGEEQEQTDGAPMEDPEEILNAASCLACHGQDLSGAAGPALNKIGAELSLDEIQDIITNGTDGGMPAQKGKLSDDEISIIAKYLSEKK